MFRGTIILGWLVFLFASGSINAQEDSGRQITDDYEAAETRNLVRLVEDAGKLVEQKGEAAFDDFRVRGSRWRRDDTYIVVLDLKGTMIVHPDSRLEGRNQINLKDINGKPIIRGLLYAATGVPGKTNGWYHYQWPVPGSGLPRWKSTYARRVSAPSGARYVVASGIYNDQMERAFVVDAVRNAVREIERNGKGAFKLLRDPTGPYLAKETYIFVIDPDGVELVNPAFRNLEGRNLLDVTDLEGKPLVREMLKVAQTRGNGWVDYGWPKPGESVARHKSAYVSRAKIGGSWVLVGCGIYLPDARKPLVTTKKLTAAELMALVREAAVVFARRGENAFPEFRERGSRWFRDDTYFFVWTLDGRRIFHAANPAGEGVDVRGLKDVIGRPYGRMFLQTAESRSGEGWVHYLHAEPGQIHPQWKSTFVKRVTFPSGKSYLTGCGVYSMEMDETFIEDLVNRAGDLVAERGSKAFAQLRDEKGSFVFMDTYVFVTTPDGTERVNAAQPNFEGKNLMEFQDVTGKFMVREYIAAAMKNGTAWVEYHWYKPGDNKPARKRAYVKRVRSGEQTYIVGSGFYPVESAGRDTGIRLQSQSSNKEGTMATYLVLFSFTEQGIEKVKESPARIEAAKKIVQDMGGEVRAFYAILGSEYDTMFVVTAPGEEKIAQMVLAIARLGNVRTRTHRLFTEEEFSSIVSGLP